MNTINGQVARESEKVSLGWILQLIGAVTETTVDYNNFKGTQEDKEEINKKFLDNGYIVIKENGTIKTYKNKIIIENERKEIEELKKEREELLKKYHIAENKEQKESISNSINIICDKINNICKNGVA